MDTNIENTVKALRRGEVILYPTDTIWGLGCDMSQEKAIEKMCMLKHIPHIRNFIILIDNVDKLADYVEDIPAPAYDLIEIVEEPLTVIYPKAKGLAKNVAGQDGSIAIRVTKHDFCVKIIKELGTPITSTSANITGQPAPIGYDSINPEIIKNVDFIVDKKYDEHTNTKASRIIAMQSNGLFKIIRH